MSLSGLLTAVNEYVGDVIVNDCGRPTPSRQLSYHGRLPHDCCTADGFLVTSWESGRPGNGDSPCGGPPVYTLTLRYVVCWSVPDADEGGVDISDAQDATWNNDALMLADVADCVGRSLTDLTCSSAPVDPMIAAILRLAPQRSLHYVGASPIVPLGGCAGVQWQLTAAVANGPVIS
jgi:hypothetical protein